MLLENNIDVLLFYGWWQFAVCLFGFIALFSIWWHIGRIRKDNGQVYLAISVLFWSFSGLTEVYFAKTNGPEVSLLGFRSVLSLFNSLFILLALPWFKYLPRNLEPIIKSRYWLYIIGLPFVFSLLPTLSKIWSGPSFGLISELDVYYAFFTLAFLGSVLWTSFRNRRLGLLAYLSMVCIGMTFIAQIFKLTQGEISLILFSAIFKTSLIMIFFALALSWVKELTENVIPSASNLSLYSFSSRLTSHKVEYYALLEGIPGIASEPILISRGNHNLLHQFVQRKLDESDDWLEIKPKESAQKDKTYDINDHNELKRLVEALLNGLFGTGLWTKEKHFKPLKESLFELSPKRERKIRLKIPKSQIFNKKP